MTNEPDRDAVLTRLVVLAGFTDGYLSEVRRFLDYLPNPSSSVIASFRGKTQALAALVGETESRLIKEFGRDIPKPPKH